MVRCNDYNCSYYIRSKFFKNLFIFKHTCQIELGCECLVVQSILFDQLRIGGLFTHKLLVTMHDA